MYTTTYDRSQPNPPPARSGGPGLGGFVRRRWVAAALIALAITTGFAVGF